MKTTAYENRAAQITAATAATKKSLPIVTRSLNLDHDLQKGVTRDGRTYTSFNGHDDHGQKFKVLLFGKAAESALGELTKGDFVEFTGRQEPWSKEYEGKTYSGMSVKVDYADKACVPYRVLAASQDKAKAKSEREAAKAKAEAGLQAKIRREAELY